MKYWIIPSNGRVFDLEGALAANQGLLDWRVKNVSVGDIVYIYKTRPDSCIKYMMEVAETDGETARLSLVDVFQPHVFPLSKLREHGIKGSIQSKMECKPETLRFLWDK